jgi:hypothetical protein
MPKISSSKVELVCKECGKAFLRYKVHLWNYGKKNINNYCSKKCESLGRVVKLENFWDRVEKSDACWIWSGSYWENGYGKMMVEKKPYLAHRISWSLTFGEIPPGLWVLHKCDNHACVRPDHLFLGTFRDNVDDMVSKGRHAKGSTSGMSKLTEEQVLKIREELKPCETIKSLAEFYNVEVCTIHRIRKRQSWKHC